MSRTTRTYKELTNGTGETQARRGLARYFSCFSSCFGGNRRRPSTLELHRTSHSSTATAADDNHEELLAGSGVSTPKGGKSGW